MKIEKSFFFVVEGAKLECQSWLLASSLSRHEASSEKVAYATRAYLPQVSDATRAHLDRCGVELRALPDAGGIWDKPYPHGNKLLAANETRRGEISVFLDTDTFLCAPLDLGDPELDVVKAVPEGVRSWGRDGRWERAYAHFGLDMPSEQIRLVRANRRLSPPYFNAGFVAFPEVGAHGRFGAQWLLTALDFDHHCRIAQKRPWLDQITLPLTLARYGWRYEVLGEQFNYSSKNRQDEVVDEVQPIVMHYHRDPYFTRWGSGRAEIDALRAMIRGEACAGA